MKKRVLCYLMVLLAVCGLVGCGEKKETGADKPTKAVESTPTATSAPTATPTTKGASKQWKEKLLSSDEECIITVNFLGENEDPEAFESLTITYAGEEMLLVHDGKCTLYGRKEAYELADSAENANYSEEEKGTYDVFRCCVYETEIAVRDYRGVTEICLEDLQSKLTVRIEHNGPNLLSMVWVRDNDRTDHFCDGKHIYTQVTEKTRGDSWPKTYKEKVYYNDKGEPSYRMTELEQFVDATIGYEEKIQVFDNDGTELFTYCYDIENPDGLITYWNGQEKVTLSRDEAPAEDWEDRLKAAYNGENVADWENLLHLQLSEKDVIEVYEFAAYGGAPKAEEPVFMSTYGYFYASDEVVVNAETFKYLPQPELGTDWVRFGAAYKNGKMEMMGVRFSKEYPETGIDTYDDHVDTYFTLYDNDKNVIMTGHTDAEANTDYYVCVNAEFRDANGNVVYADGRNDEKCYLRMSEEEYLAVLAKEYQECMENSKDKDPGVFFGCKTLELTDVELLLEYDVIYENLYAVKNGAKYSLHDDRFYVSFWEN